jgi:hypothetical protein
MVLQMKIIVERAKNLKPDNIKLVGMFIEQNKELYLGSNDVDGLAARIQEMYPAAKLSKHKGYVLVEKQ